jgi:hypothetical protein
MRFWQRRHSILVRFDLENHRFATNEIGELVTRCLFGWMLGIGPSIYREVISIALTEEAI